MNVVATIINFYVRKRMPDGFKETDSMDMALDSARQRWSQESTELLEDLLLVREQEKKHHGNEDRSK